MLTRFRGYAPASCRTAAAIDRATATARQHRELWGRLCRKRREQRPYHRFIARSRDETKHAFYMAKTGLRRRFEIFAAKMRRLHFLHIAPPAAKCVALRGTA